MTAAITIRPGNFGDLALVLSTLIFDNFRLSMLLVAPASIVAPLPDFWTIPTAYLSQTAAAAGIAIITSLGNLSGALSPFVIRLIKTHSGRLSIGIDLKPGIHVLLLEATQKTSMAGTSPAMTKQHHKRCDIGRIYD